MATATLVTIDRQPFFDKVLQYGVRNGVITSDRLDQILTEGAKGIVQIANFFGSAYLRSDLDVARDRLITLSSLFLEHISDGDLLAAAKSLNGKSVLFHSKGGSDLLRQLCAMPEEQEQMLDPHLPSADELKNRLNEWTFASPIDCKSYRRQLSARKEAQLEIDFANWLLKRFGESGDIDSTTAEIVSSAMLVLFVKDAPLRMPTRLDFIRLFKAARVKRVKLDEKRLSNFVSDMPSVFAPLAHKAMNDFLEILLPTIRREGSTIDSVLHGDEALNIHIREDINEDNSVYERLVSAKWHRVTSGESDDPKVIATILLRIAAGLAPKSTLLKRDAKEIVRTFRENRFNSKAVEEFVDSTAPIAIRSDLKSFWNEDLLIEASDAIADLDPEFPDSYMSRAMAYLRRTCRAGWVVDDK